MLSTASERDLAAPNRTELDEWEELAAQLLAEKRPARPEAEALLRLVAEVRRLRTSGRELLDAYRQAHLDGEAEGLADDEVELASEVGHHRAVFSA